MTKAELRKLLSAAMSELGKRTSEKKKASSAANGKLGGRPKGKQKANGKSPDPLDKPSG